MTDLAAELDQKLTQLAPAKARGLERMVRDAMALADASGKIDADADELLNLRVYPLPLGSGDFGRLREAIDEPVRELPRLRDLLREPGRLGHA